MRTIRLMLLALLVSSGTASAQETLTITKIDTPAATDLTLVPTTDVILNPTGKDVLPGLGYDVNLGMLTKKYLTLHAAELWVETLVAQNTIATIGGRVLVGPTTTFVVDVGTGDTTIHVKHNQMVNGDRAYSEANAAVEFFAITSAASSHSGHFDYTVTRNLDGTGANAWTAGDAIFNTGQTGNGFIDLYSVRGMNAGTEIGPTIVGNVRTGSTYNAWSPRWAIGNLDGLYGYSGSTYGAAFGVPSGARVTVDSTTGIRIYGGDNDQKVTIDTSGNATFDGNLTIGTGRNMLRNTECRVGGEDYSVAVSHALAFTNPPGRAVDVDTAWALGDVAGCYVTVSGTPAAATVTDAHLIQDFQVTAGKRYEFSAYLGLHRTNGYVYFHWINSSGSGISSDAGNTCLANVFPAGNDLASWCRSGGFAIAPSGAVTARLIIRAEHIGGSPAGTDPYIFWVWPFIGEAGVAQEDFSPWSPGGITEITGGIIRTDAVNARIIAADSITTSELAADSVTSAKIVAGTIVGGDIAANTITGSQIAANAIDTDELNANAVTAAKISVTSLSAITANLGTVTAGTIDGVTGIFGSGDEVTLNSSGITLAAGTGTNNRIKWSGGNDLWSDGAGMYTDGNFTVEDILVVNGASGVDMTVPDVAVGNSFNFINIPSGTGTTVVVESGGDFKKDSSSVRYKENVREWNISNARDLLTLRPIKFDYINGTKDVGGFSAEQVYKVAPEAVNLDAQGLPDSIRQGALNAYLLRLIQDLYAEIDALKRAR